MRTLVLSILLIPAVSLIAQSNLAQPNSPKGRQPIFRNATAVAAVEQAIAALGGHAALAGTQSWMASGTSIVNGEAQPVLWEATRDDFRVARGPSGSQSLFTSGHGHPAMQRASGVSAIPYHVYRSWIRPFAIGALLQQEIDDKNYSFELVTYKDPSVTVVKTVDHRTLIEESVTPQLWYFAKSTGLPQQIIYRQHDPKHAAAFTLVTMTLGDYRRTGAVLAPFAMEYSSGGKTFETVQFTSVEVNANISDSDFAALPVENPEGNQ